MDPRDPQCPCDRCGRPRAKHYFEDPADGAAFPSDGACDRLVPPGKLAEVEAAERVELRQAIVKAIKLAGPALRRWLRKK